MRVLVTGGSGFIGRHLCRALIAAEHQVRVLTRQDDIFGLPDTATILRIDNFSASTPWIDILGDVDAVIHLAEKSMWIQHVTLRVLQFQQVLKDLFLLAPLK